METVKFGKIFKKLLINEINIRRNKTPQGVAKELNDMGMGSEGQEQPIPLAPESPLTNDLEQTSNLTDPMQKIRAGINKKINTWITTCQKLSDEINGTNDKSWVKSLQAAYPEEAAAITAQLSKTAGQLLTAVNDLRTIVNQPPKENKL